MTDDMMLTLLRVLIRFFLVCAVIGVLYSFALMIVASSRALRRQRILKRRQRELQCEWDEVFAEREERRRFERIAQANHPRWQ